MKVCGVFVTTVATLPLLLPPSTHAATPRSLSATVERVSDGDTVVAITANQTKLRLRLLGIDAPEIAHGKKPGQPLGEEARGYLASLLEGKRVRVEAFGADRYRRILAFVWLGDLNVNLEMLRRGLAEMYRGTKCAAYCRETEQVEATARRERVGMWSLGAQYESPATFRWRMRIRGD